jgi:tetratricopeptide (TPR) repeat protein
MYKLCRLLGILALGLLPRTALRAEDYVDQWRLERDLQRGLLEDGKDLAQLLQARQEFPPRSEADFMELIYLQLYAGLHEDAKRTLGELKTMMDGRKLKHVSYPDSVYSLGTGRFQAWDLALYTAEQCGALMSSGLDRELEEELVKNRGWTPAQLDAWLAARGVGVENSWVMARVRYRKKLGTARELVRELADAVKKEPGSLAAAKLYLAAAGEVCYDVNGQREFGEVAWLAAEFKPRRAVDAWDIGYGLESFGQYEGGAAVYRKALEMPFTDEDRREVSSRYNIFIPQENLLPMFQSSVKSGLSKCLRALGQNQEAQKLMEEVTLSQDKTRFGGDLRFAGQTQAVTGFRSVEKAVLAQETESKDSVEYWRQRLDYYTGRNELPGMETAVKEILRLSPMVPPENGQTRDFGRSMAIGTYVNVLRQMGRDGEAKEFIYKELADALPGTESGRAALEQAMASDLFDPAHPAIWQWLEKQRDWSAWNEERVIRMMLEGKSQDILTRLEKMVTGELPGRSLALGNALRTLDQKEKALPHLRDAYSGAVDWYMQDRASSNLFHTYLELGYWRQAHTMLKGRTLVFAGPELPQNQTRMIQAALKEGQREDAVKIFWELLRSSPYDLESVEKLARAGLEPEIREGYKTFNERFPGSVLPARAEEALQRARTPAE